jgi:hypothetical protein
MSIPKLHVQFHATQTPHRSSLRTGFPRLIGKLIQLWKGKAVEDALPGEEGGAVKLECQECSKELLIPAGGWECMRNPVDSHSTSMSLYNSS